MPFSSDPQASPGAAPANGPPPVPRDQAPQRHDPYAALRIANFRRYFIGNGFSLIGSNMTTYTVAYELYQRTGSALVLGMVGLVQVIPIMLLALPAGHFVDRFNRRALILISTAIQICLWVLVGLSSRYANQWVPGLAEWFHLGDAHTPIMLGLLLINGMCRAVNQPARQTLLPMLVPAAHFPNAIMWNAVLFESSNVVGPMLGGFALALLLGAHSPGAGGTAEAMGGATWAYACIYFANAGCQLIQWVNIARVHLNDLPAKAPTGPRDSMFQSIAEGVRFVHGQKIILGAIALDMFAVLLGGATALLPVFAQQVLHVGPIGLAGLRAAPSVGAVLMAMLLAHTPPMKHAGRNLLLAVTGFGAATIVFGLSQNYVLSLAALFAAGLCDNISVVVRHSLVQLLTPDAMRGRVNSVNTVFISSSNELGEFESGTTAAIGQSLVARWWGAAVALMWGPMLAVVAGGAGTIVVVITAALLWPELARVGRLEDLRAQEPIAPEEFPVPAAEDALPPPSVPAA